MQTVMPDQSPEKPLVRQLGDATIDSIRRTDAAIDAARGSDWAAFVAARQAIADQIVSYLNFCRAMAMESTEQGWLEKAAEWSAKADAMENALATLERPADSDDAADRPSS
jgi:hypothetical protein